MKGFICNRCTFLKFFSNEVEIDKSLIEFLYGVGEHVACENCGIGEMKVKEGIIPSDFCEKCSLHKKKCRCDEKKWNM